MPDLDLRWIGFTVYGPGATFGPYTTDFHELIWIVEGDVEITDEDVVHTAPPGTVVLSEPGHRYFYRWDPASTTRHGFLHFFMDPGNDSGTIVRSLPDDDIVIALFRHILWLESARPDDWKALATSALSHAVTAFVTGASNTAADIDPHLPAIVHRCMQYMRHQWTASPIRSPSLAELAASASVTPEHLCRVFKTHFGCGPIEAIRILRLQRAGNFLARSNMPVGQVAKLCGFDNQFHFSRAFKALFGVSPRAFRAGERADVDQPKAVRRLTVYVP
jgi:AraC-like DNA-binding protein